MFLLGLGGRLCLLMTSSDLYIQQRKAHLGDVQLCSQTLLGQPHAFLHLTHTQPMAAQTKSSNSNGWLSSTALER